MNKFRTLRADEIDCICSDDGRVFDSDWNELSQRSNHGYSIVSMKTKGGWKNHLVHRLIAMCFLDNPENKPCVNHKDGDKKNNTVSNLEWCTYSENELHSHRVLGKTTSRDHLERMREIHVAKASQTVKQVDERGDVVAVYKSEAEASRITGISQGNISECCTGRRKKAGGYKWEKCLDC